MSQRGDGQGRRAEETNSDDTFLWQICQPDLTAGDGARLALAGFTAAAVLHTPYYISHYISNTFSPLHSAERTAATLTFIDVGRILKARSVWAGSGSGLLKTDDIHKHTNCRGTDV